MKRVVSVSLGSHLRDHSAQLTVLGETVAVYRQGTDGDLAAARGLIAKLAARRAVDAIGLGGIDRYLVVAGRRYEIRDAQALAEAAGTVPVVDGSGVKATWEPRVVERLLEAGRLHVGQRVLMVSALDRFGMAEAFFGLGFATVAGDLIFGSRINYPIRSLLELEEMARKLLPEMVKLPFSQLYPVGDQQTAEPDRRFARYFAEADVIAGDFHYIRRYLPDDLTDKTVITNTTTAHDVKLLEARAIRCLVTTTPVLGGRSFGANLVEAALVAVSGIDADHPEWPGLVERAGLTFSVRDWREG
ncbi:MAG: quinate 5-dehydrogenase [Thermaerobacter sp.]|nr:quinate 5-dehydrogenase [Thermaerobacter sp.]